MKKVSVIIPCFNATQWLPQCFLSLAGQTIGIEQTELIFVDDASTDDGKTWELLQEFERAYPENVLIIPLQENMRQGGARNVALQYASGEYVAFVDADDFVSEDFLEKTYQRAKETDADIVQFEYQYYTARLGAFPSGRAVVPEQIVIQNDEERRRFLLSEKISYGCWNKLYRRELLRQAGVRYAEHVIYEEPLFVYPLLFYGTRYVIMEECFYFYRQNDAGTMWKDMKSMDTLLMHASVQLQVWQFMKNTPFFRTFYEEIKLYFLHTYLFETLVFAGQRGFHVALEEYGGLVKTAAGEVPDFTGSPYSAMLPKQMELYRLIAEGLTQERLDGYVSGL